MLKTGEIATIGYEGTSIADFVAVLSDLGIQLLYDVRELPSSRKKGFSKNALREALEAEGISYIHDRQLGDPKAGREAARAGDLEKFRQIFESHMASTESKAAVENLVERAQQYKTCLMCYERNPKHCHRHIVIDRVLEIGHFDVRHLGVPTGYSLRE